MEYFVIGVLLIIAFLTVKYNKDKKESVIIEQVSQYEWRVSTGGWIPLYLKSASDNFEWVTASASPALFSEYPYSVYYDEERAQNAVKLYFEFCDKQKQYKAKKIQVFKEL